MKMKVFSFTTLLLAVASLGLALPPKAPHPKASATPTITTTPSTPSFPPADPKTPVTPNLPAAIPQSPDQLVSVLEAQGGGQVSKQCATAIITIVTSPEFLQCIPVSAFLPLLPIVTDPSFLTKFLADPAGTFKKTEPALVQFSTTFCAAQKCSDDGVTKAIETLELGCSDEIKNNPLIKLVFSLAAFYSPIHDDICFKSHNKGNEFCWDETLTTVFSLPKSPIKIVDGGIVDSIAVADPEAVCTTCNKDLVDTFFNFLKSKKSDDIVFKILAGVGIDNTKLAAMTTGAAVKCGLKFIDGNIPDKPGK